MNRVEFDSTLDEIVDVNMRLVEHTAAHRQQRRQSQWAFGLCAAIGLVAIILGRNDRPSYAALAYASVAIVAGGSAVGFLYGRFHDWYVRDHHRRLVSEMYGGVERIHWTFEVRTDTLCVISPYGDVSFPWVRLTRIHETQGAIELWFDPGLAIVRDRAFQTQEERDRFLDAVKGHVPIDNAG